MRPIFVVAVLAGGASLAAAQGTDGLEPLAGTGRAEFTAVAQTGGQARALGRALERIRLPDGFRIALYAVAPGARGIAVSPDGTVVFVGTRGDTVWSIADRDGDGVADDVRDFAPAIDKTMPNGPCFGPDGSLYVPELNRIVVYPDAAAARDAPAPPAFAVVRQGALIPPEEEASVHGARVCRVGPDGGLYISLGQPYNVPPKSKLALYDAWGIGGIVRMDADGTGRRVYASGIRNSVGMDFNPANGELWFTDNQVDRMGDDIPPGEINRVTAPGQNFGFPWYGGGTVRTPQYEAEEIPEGVVDPAVEMTAHAADLGMTFYAGGAFPRKYHGGIFNAQHGSWNRSTPVGARVMFTAVNPDGSAGETEVFAEGWLTPDGEYIGRPVDVAVLPDGSLLVSDDRAGAVYRISYGG